MNGSIHRIFRHKSWLAGLGLALALVLMNGCSGSESDFESAKAPLPASPLVALWLNDSQPHLAPGTAGQFSAWGRFADGSTLDLSHHVHWHIEQTSASQNVARLDGSGQVLAQSPGAATLFADLFGQTAQTILTVPAATLSTISISPSNPSIAKGADSAFSAIATFSDGSSQDVTRSAAWSITDVAPSRNVASINALGQVKGENEGKALVAASLMGQVGTTILTVTHAALAEIALSPDLPLLVLGSRQQFVATAVFSDGSRLDVTNVASWGVSDIAPGIGIASISTQGVATATNVGRASITATYLGKSDTTCLTVIRATLRSIELRPPSPSIAKGTSLEFIATAHFSDGSQQELSTEASWTATDVAPGTGVASINSAGVAVARNEGQSSIRVTYMGLSAQTTLTVTPAVLTGLAVGPSGAATASGTSVQLTATGRFSDGSTQDVSRQAVWMVADIAPGTDVASVDGTGLAFGKHIGQARITATFAGRSATSVLTVTPAVLTAVELHPATPLVAVGNSMMFTLVGVFSDGSRQDVTASATWNIADVPPQSGVASIDSIGIVRGLSEGQATVTGRINGLSDQTVLTVCVGAWNVQSSGTTQHLYAIWGSDASHVWAVGAHGAVDTWNGSFWRLQPSGTTQDLYAVWGTSARNIWAVGAAGLILKWDGASWRPQPSGVSGDIMDVWGIDANNVWATVRDGATTTILKWDGRAWYPQTNFNGSLSNIWGSSTSSVWAVGWDHDLGGQIVNWDGSAWHQQLTGIDESLHAVWGSDARNIWAVGSGSRIWKWNGSTWNAEDLGAITNLYNVWGTDANNVWAIGGSYGVLKRNGSAWKPEYMIGATLLQGIWGSDARNIWAVGLNGMIQKRIP